jgi:hypothetical protein
VTLPLFLFHHWALALVQVAATALAVANGADPVVQTGLSAAIRLPTDLAVEDDGIELVRVVIADFGPDGPPGSFG